MSNGKMTGEITMKSREVVVTSNHPNHHSANKFSTFHDSFVATAIDPSNYHTTTAKQRKTTTWARGTLILNRFKRSSPKSSSNDKHNNEDYLKNFHSSIQDTVDDDFEFKRLQRRLKESKYTTFQGSKMVLCKYFEGNDGGKYMV